VLNPPSAAAVGPPHVLDAPSAAAVVPPHVLDAPSAAAVVLPPLLAAPQAADAPAPAADAPLANGADGAVQPTCILEEVRSFCLRQAVVVQGLPALKPRRRKRARNEPMLAENGTATQSQNVEMSGTSPPDPPSGCMGEAFGSPSRPAEGLSASSHQLPLPKSSPSFSSRKRKAACPISEDDEDDPDHVPIATVHRKLSRITKLADMPQVNAVSDLQHVFAVPYPDWAVNACRILTSCF
jgi:hypothetical protein